MWFWTLAGLPFYYTYTYICICDGNNAAQRFGLNEVMCVDHDSATKDDQDQEDHQDNHDNEKDNCDGEGDGDCDGDGTGDYDGMKLTFNLS